MSTKSYSRREFLKLFSGGSAKALSKAVAALLPDAGLTAEARKRLRAENLARARRERDAPADASTTRCLQCYALFAPSANEILCPRCRQAETNRCWPIRRTSRLQKPSSPPRHGAHREKKQNAPG